MVGDVLIPHPPKNVATGISVSRRPRIFPRVPLAQAVSALGWPAENTRSLLHALWWEQLPPGLGMEKTV